MRVGGIRTSGAAPSSVDSGRDRREPRARHLQRTLDRRLDLGAA
jgi:hypothetical protein